MAEDDAKLDEAVKKASEIIKKQRKAGEKAGSKAPTK